MPPRHLLSDLAHFSENFCVEMGSDPESGDLNQVIEHGFGQRDKSVLFRSGHDAEKTGNR
jgi:hypothetical protein